MQSVRTAVIGVIAAGCLLAAGCVHHHHRSQPVVVEPPAPASVPVDADPAVEMFYDDLAPYGEWVYVDGPGWVWAPYDVAPDWGPYQYGHWVYTDYGWTWASDEDFGWAVYHYGRWHHAPRYGWVWVPGTDWGPAWVAWHQSDAWVGWAPLPYHVRWRAGVGLDWGHSSVQVSIQSGHWSFVATRYMVEPHIHRHVAPRSRNVTYTNTTRNVTNYTYIDNRVINNSVQVNTINRAIGRPVHRHHVRHADHPGRARGGRNDGDDLVIYRPREHPGRTPQRRPVPPGHADERKDKNDRNGLRGGGGGNDREERPTADRPGRKGTTDDGRSSQPTTRPSRKRLGADDRGATTPPDRGGFDKGRKPLSQKVDERDKKSTPPHKSADDGGTDDRPGAQPPERSNTRTPGRQLQSAPKSSRKPRDDARPADSDARRPGTPDDRPSASPRTGSQGQAAQDGGKKSTGLGSKSTGTAKRGGKPSLGKKGEKPKPADPEDEEEKDADKKNSKKRD